MPEQRDGAYRRLADALRAMPAQLSEKPAAVLMVSAHWEEPQATVMTHPHPPMIYDYFGFPEHTYSVRYAAPGSPALAEQVRRTLTGAGIESGSDAERGFDHGMYSPMALIYPAADMPTVQLSLLRSLDPLEHVRLGRALAPLREQNVLIVGSGLSYHNLRAFGPAGKAPSAAFDAWLAQTLAIADPDRRIEALCDWQSAPAARQAHPREEHLIPLMVALGAAAAEPVSRVYHETDFIGTLTVSSYRFG